MNCCQSKRLLMITPKLEFRACTQTKPVNAKKIQLTVCQCHVLDGIVKESDLEYFFEPLTFF